MYNACSHACFGLTAVTPGQQEGLHIHPSLQKQHRHQALEGQSSDRMHCAKRRVTARFISKQ